MEDIEEMQRQLEMIYKDHLLGTTSGYTARMGQWVLHQTPTGYSLWNKKREHFSRYWSIIIVLLERKLEEAKKSRQS